MHPDYHIEVLHSFYSVPYRLIGRQVDVQLTHRMIKILHNHGRVAVHHRRGQRGAQTIARAAASARPAVPMLARE